MKTGKVNNSQKNPQSSDSFLEAFRGLGSGLASDVKDSFFPFTQNKPTPGPDTESDFLQRETELKRKYNAHFQRAETIRREETVLFTRERRETQQQVKSLQTEIGKLAKSVGELSSEVQKAEILAIQEVPEIGTYHLNFFQKLRKVIANLRSQIQESSFWLAAWNKRSQKKNFYWKQFKKSGSKFLLSPDRYMSTQAG